jgi:uncharacterized protein YdeI (YjbR/CyaY-like superfamily)
MKPLFFRTQPAFRKWLSVNHDKATELLVGFYKKSSGKKSIVYQEALDEALCFGWIDGIRKTLDDISYTIRFTPRKRRSNWSAVNIARVGVLERQGLMMPPGANAFAARDPARADAYSYENRPAELDSEYRQKFESDRQAWEFFRAQPPSYKKVLTWWVVSAKKEETRLRRLATLIDASRKGLRLR